MSLIRTSVEVSQAGEHSFGKQSDVQLNDLHAKRLETLNSRDEAMLAEANALAVFLKSEPDISEVDDVSQVRYKYPITATQTFYSTIAGHNIPGYSYCFPGKLKYREKGISYIIAKEVQIKNFRPFPAHFLQSYALLKYFSTTKKLFCQRIFEIFRFRTKNVYVFFMTVPVEYQSVRSALLNGRIVNSTKQIDEESLPLDVLIQQLISAAEQLNVCGVAHRYLTVDNVFIGPEKSIQFGSFDFATVFFNPTDQVKVLCPKGLGIALPSEYYEHLPPEAFTSSGYDASMTDVWSIAVLLCRILIGATPFEALTKIQCSNPDRYIIHWRESECRPMIPDAYRLFIDEIFRPAAERMTLLDLLNDPFWIKKSPKRLYPYYRIDIREAINVDRPPNALNSFNMDVFANRVVPTVSDGIKRAFHSKDQFKFADKLEDIISEYIIDIPGSFTDELKVFTDSYYKAVRQKGSTPCVLRIFCHSYPSRYRKLMASESCKIARYCQNSSQRKCFLEIYDIFSTPNGKTLWIFYESIAGYRPLSTICVGENLVVRQLVHWFFEIIHAMESIAESLAAHRYIRPEFVFVHSETQSIKITHFDMAGFSINPEHEKLSPRTCGMQDELESIWNHVPPETFNSRYDICTFDVWSFGVLVCYCMTLGKWPFSTDQLRNNWMAQWIQYRSRYSSSLEIIPDMSSFLNRIFVDWEQRLPVSELEKNLKDLTNKGERTKPSGKKKPPYNSNIKVTSIGPSSLMINRKLRKY